MSTDSGLLGMLALLLIAGAVGLLVTSLAAPDDASADEPVTPRSPLSLQLWRAGLAGRLDATGFFAAKIGLALLSGLMVLTFVDPVTLPGAGRTLFAIGAAALGFVTPSVSVRLRAEERQRKLLGDLPDLLDLIVTCLEAGLGLEEAVRRASRGLGRHAQVLEAELSATLDDWMSGRSRVGAIEELRQRSGVDGLAEFMTAIDEARREGTTITAALRGQAEAMRKAEAARIQEWARRVPILVVVNLAIFVLPAAFIAVLGSSIVQAVRSLIPLL